MQFIKKLKKIKTTHVTDEKVPLSSPAVFCSDSAFNVFILTLKSKPINTTRELIKIRIMKTIIVPIDPYNTLKRPKLLMNVENPMVDRMLSNVAITAPGETSFHGFVVDGAYRYINANE